jgi:hypothetical protein
MENGRWRETTDKEHNEIRDAESGKVQLQESIRKNGRFAYGYEDKKGFHIDAGGVIKLKSINNLDGHKNVETMNESACKNVYKAIQGNKKLLTLFTTKILNDPKDASKGGKSLMEAFEKRLGELSKNPEFDEKFDDAKEMLET